MPNEDLLTAETTEFIDDADIDVDNDVEEIDDDDVRSAEPDNGEVVAEETIEDHETNNDANDEQPEQEVKAPKGEKNSEQAEARRQREREKIRNNAIIEAIGTNPYTGQKLEDATDVEEYLIMKRIADRGDDPITEYYKELKNVMKQRNKGYEEYLKAQTEQVEYLSAHPEDENILETAQFKKFSEKLKGVSLENVVEAYKIMRGNADTEIKKEVKQTVAQMNANRKASPGSVKGTADTSTSNEFYSFDQLRNMSPEEIERNWDKVEKSYDKLHRKK